MAGGYVRHYLFLLIYSFFAARQLNSLSKVNSNPHTLNLFFPDMLTDTIAPFLFITYREDHDSLHRCTRHRRWFRRSIWRAHYRPCASLYLAHSARRPVLSELFTILRPPSWLAPDDLHSHGVVLWYCNCDQYQLIQLVWIERDQAPECNGQEFDRHMQDLEYLAR